MEGTLWCQRIAINSSPQITFNEARMQSCRPKTGSHEKPHSTAPTILQDVQSINGMVWPANSPDLNPIENLWSWLDRQIAKDLPGDTDQLRASISNNLSNVQEKIIQNLVDSMPTRIRHEKSMRRNKILKVHVVC
jgi:hypothetical protein